MSDLLKKFQNLIVRENKKSLKIGVIAGGVSSAREISLLTGKNIYDSLLRSGYNAVFNGDTDNINMGTFTGLNGLNYASFYFRINFDASSGTKYVIYKNGQFNATWDGTNFTFYITDENWRLCYKIGGMLGFVLLLLRVSVAESGMFKAVKNKDVQRGNFFMFFTNTKRFKKYIYAILIGLPTWYVIGILVNYSNRFATEFYGNNAIVSGKAIMYAYIAIAFGDIIIGFVSQYYKSRKKALLLFYILCIIAMVMFYSPLNNSDISMYAICALLGFSTGFWAIFVTIGAEQFGTNLRATAATTIPNMVRGALPLINLLFLDIFQKSWNWNLVQSGIVTAIIVMSIALFAFFKTEETFYKDLNYVEK